jgi:hypothetical protein
LASGKTNDALYDILNRKALTLKIEQEQLRIEQRKLLEKLRPLEQNFDEKSFRRSLVRFSELSEKATEEERQRLFRLLVKRIDWLPEGEQRMLFYYLPEPKRDKDWFATSVRSDGPDRIRTGDLLRDRQTCWASTPRDQIVNDWDS